MHITAVRHGETSENAAGIIQGQLYGTLSPTGQQQIQQLGEQLSNDSYSVCYSSDLERCEQTAQAVLQYHQGMPFYVDERLRERSMTPFEGKKFTDVDWDWSNDKKLDFKTPEGEDWQTVINRVASFLNDTYASHMGDDVLVVSHGGPMRAMIALLDNQAWREVGSVMIDNCEVRQWIMDSMVNPSNVRQ